MKVLLPVDGSRYTQQTLDYIASHPALFGAGNDYVAVTAIGHIPGYAASFLQRGMVEDYYRDEAEKVLHPVREFSQKNGWKLSTRFAIGQPAEAISAVVKEEQPELIVMGSHGHSALVNVVLGSVATAVLARSQVPVLIVR